MLPGYNANLANTINSNYVVLKLTNSQNWTITLDDPIVIREGAPGLYGDSATDLYWDNLSLKVSE